MEARVNRRSVLGIGAAAAAGSIVAAASPAAAHTTSDTVFNVKDATFGAHGTGLHDDTAAIQSAIDAAITAGGGVVWLPAGRYRLTRSLKLNGPGFAVYDRPVTLQGTGPASVLYASNVVAGTPGFPADWQYSGNHLIEAYGRQRADDTDHILGASASAGSQEIEVPQGLADTLAVGDVLGLEEDAPGAGYRGDGRPLELHKVVTKKGSDGRTIGLDSPLVLSYTSDAVPYKKAMIQGVTIRDLSIKAVIPPRSDPNSPAKEVYSLRIKDATDVNITNVTVRDAAGGMLLYNVVDAHIADTVVDGLRFYENSYGYGLAVAGGSANVVVSGLVGRNTRHLFTTLSDQRPGQEIHYGGPRDVVVIGGVGEGGPPGDDGELPKSVWDTHEFGTDISFVGCTATGVGNAYGAFQIRSTNTRILGCEAKNSSRGIRIREFADNAVVSGCRLSHNDFGILADNHSLFVRDTDIGHSSEYGVSFGGGAVDVAHVVDCFIHDSKKVGIRDQSPAGSKAKVVVITGNVVPKGSTSEWPQNGSVHLVGGTHSGGEGCDVVIANNVVRGFGASNDGTYQVVGTKQNNVTDP